MIMTGRLGVLRSISPVWIAVVAVYLASSLISPAMFSLHQALNILQVAAFLGVVAGGQTFALLVGGIDLSVAGVVTMTNILSTSIMLGRAENLLPGIVVPLAVAALAGLVNGLLVAVLRITPLIATLSTNSILYGTALVYTGGAVHGNASPNLVPLGTGYLFGLPASTLCWLALTIFAAMLLRRTPYGRRLYAVGANLVAAHLAGVAVKPMLVSAYIFSSLFAALGGLLLTAYIGAPSLGIGDQFMLTSVAAVVVGGTALTGGVGSVVGSFGGALLIAELNSFTNVIRVNTGTQYVIQGAIIVLGVLLYQLVDRVRRIRPQTKGG